MKNLTFKNITKICNGIYIGNKNIIQQEIDGISTNSNKISKNFLFIAINGKHINANLFINDAIKNGASCIITENNLKKIKIPYIKVKSSLNAIKNIAKFYVKQFKLEIIGITGSTGKTSTKEFIFCMLKKKYNILKTNDNFNNKFGISYTLFNLKSKYQILILEMGINHCGEMDELIDIVKPNICIITNIGLSHLKFLKSRDLIFKEKIKIFRYFKNNDNIILNGDDNKLITINNVNGITPIFFGINNHNCSIWVDNIKNDYINGIYCKIHVFDNYFNILIPFINISMIYNILASIAICTIYNISINNIKNSIKKLHQLKGRFNIIKIKNKIIIDDCYNANPVSMKSSIDTLSNMHGKKIAILGDMNELGYNEVKLHQKIGLYIIKKNIDKIICIGNLAKEIIKIIKLIEPMKDIMYFNKKEKLLNIIFSIIQDSDIILVKASNFMHFDVIIKYLKCYL